jgi:steroid delta-isomerase-like uncharacterized protein
MMTRQEIVDLLEQHRQAVQRRDLDSLVALHADRCVVESPMGGRTTGHDGLRRVYEAWFAAFPDVEFAWEPPIVDGERVARITTVSGTDRGGFMGMQPTGKHFSMPIVQLFTIGDGVIVQERRIYDFTGLLVQIGAIKAKPA